MIPALHELLAACRYLERRFEWEELLEDDVIEACHAEASRLSQSRLDEPAAIFFAFSRHAVFLADAYTVIPLVLSRNHAHSLGYRLEASRYALVDLKHEVSAGLHSFDHVRAWFERRLVLAE